MNERSGDGESDRNARNDRQFRQENTLSCKTDNILDFIDAHPHLGAESKDDAKCKAAFQNLGILDRFTRAETPTLSVLTYRDHRTHWIVGLLWSGYAKPDENGYRMICIPKQLVPEDGVKLVVEQILESVGGHDREDGKMVVYRS